MFLKSEIRISKSEKNPKSKKQIFKTLLDESVKKSQNRHPGGSRGPDSVPEQEGSLIKTLDSGFRRNDVKGNL
jgi:hypothetical protein